MCARKEEEEEIFNPKTLTWTVNFPTSNLTSPKSAATLPSSEIL
jgi:hypothetical protein